MPGCCASCCSCLVWVFILTPLATLVGVSVGIAVAMKLPEQVALVVFKVWLAAAVCILLYHGLSGARWCLRRAFPPSAAPKEGKAD
mmetsp:Transcript_89652/g.238155  ORF Transcript_89652/g.238155 Transcript_89652/m.238155 type:complete len:86 (+) Transcript_89652:123-380(+)